MTRNISSEDSIKTADYLLKRLRQLGIRSVFGVPGDYNLRLLDFVEPAGLHWVGNCNELNAAYAADGYARINGLGALITTFGVGELSALNGIAGAYAEKAAVIHIVGSPARNIQQSRSLMHHTLADGDYRHFAAISSHVTTSQVNLMDSRMAPEKIDWALKQAIIYGRPVYIEVPDDMPDVFVSASGLKNPIAIPSAPRANHESQLETRILSRMYEAQRPLILVDGESRHLKILELIDQLAKSTGWPTWTTIFGKSLVNEQLPNVYGIYSGSLGVPEWKDYVDSADLILNFGPHHTDTNSQSFSTIPRKEVTITFSESTVQVDNDVYRDVSSSFLSRLLKDTDYARLSRPTGPAKLGVFVQPEMSDLIVQKSFWHYINLFIHEGDLILTETGTAAHGGRNFKLPPNTRLLTAVTWLSIGYMLPAALGAALAQRELREGNDSRAILFIGDGSLQMTAQEISTIIKEKLDIIIFIINNAGYTIERAIHGRNQAYNDIMPWNHSHILSMFGADTSHAAKNMFSARTYAELETALTSEEIQRGHGLRVVEVFMEREDVQGALLKLLNKQIASEQN